MKKLILILVLIPTISFAGQWCKWDGSKGVSCQGDSKGYIIVDNGFKVSTESILNGHGFYELTITEPTVGANQVKDAEVWGLVGNQMSLTWTVRDMTTTEIDERTAGPMTIEDYLQFKILTHPTYGIVTKAQLRTYLENNYPEVIDAFEARDRLENP